MSSMVRSVSPRSQSALHSLGLLKSSERLSRFQDNFPRFEERFEIRGDTWSAVGNGPDQLRLRAIHFMVDSELYCAGHWLQTNGAARISLGF
jgi:hypothetical protein